MPLSYVHKRVDEGCDSVALRFVDLVSGPLPPRVPVVESQVASNRAPWATNFCAWPVHLLSSFSVISFELLSAKSDQQRHSDSSLGGFLRREKVFRFGSLDRKDAKSGKNQNPSIRV
jgi:hypothetical protein